MLTPYPAAHSEEPFTWQQDRARHAILEGPVHDRREVPVPFLREGFPERQPEGPFRQDIAARVIGVHEDMGLAPKECDRFHG